MTVKELIEELWKWDHDAPVYILRDAEMVEVTDIDKEKVYRWEGDNLNKVSAVVIK